MSTLRENMNEFIHSLMDTEEKLKHCPEDVSIISNCIYFLNTPIYIYIIAIKSYW